MNRPAASCGDLKNASGLKTMQTAQPNTTRTSKEVLLIHLGGLGDVCLSESTFLSLRHALGNGLVGLAYPRILGLFASYFTRIEDVGSRRWIHLLGNARDQSGGTLWQRICFIGKDRSGTLRERLQKFSVEPLLFIEMYPQAKMRSAADRVHVETFQLGQVKSHGFSAMTREVVPVPSQRVVLYPEKGFHKRKWPVENFLRLQNNLAGSGLNATVLSPPELHDSLPDSPAIHDLKDMAAFLRKGGLFVSNDCGVAHLAGAMGMSTVTVFHEYDPAIWHPRGCNVSLRCPDDGLSVDTVESAVRAALDGLSLSSEAKRPGTPSSHARC